MCESFGRLLNSDWRVGYDSGSIIRLLLSYGTDSIIHRLLLRGVIDSVLGR
jgi:hypothetical protein